MTTTWDFSIHKVRESPSTNTKQASCLSKPQSSITIQGHPKSYDLTNVASLPTNLNTISDGDILHKKMLSPPLLFLRGAGIPVICWLTFEGAGNMRKHQILGA